MQGVTSVASKKSEVSITKASLSSSLRMKNKGEVWSNTSTTSRESFRGNSTSTNTNFAPVLDYNSINRDNNRNGGGPEIPYSNSGDDNNAKEEVLLFERSTSAPPPPFADVAATVTSTRNDTPNGFNTSTSSYRPLLEDLLSATTLTTKFAPSTSTTIGKSGTSSHDQNNFKDFYHAGNSLTWDSQTFKRMGGFSSLFAAATNQKTRFLEDVDELYSTTTATTATAKSRLEDLFQRNNHNTVGPFTNTSGGIYTSDTVRSLPSNHGRSRITSNSTAVSDLQSLFLQPSSTTGRPSATPTAAATTTTASSDISSPKFTNMNITSDNSHHPIPNNSSSYDDDSAHLAQANNITINALSCLNSPRQKSNKACDSTSTTTHATMPPTMSLEQQKQQQQESHRRPQDHSVSATPTTTSTIHLAPAQPQPPPGLSNTGIDPNHSATLQQQQLPSSTQAPYYTTAYPSSEMNATAYNGNIVYPQPVFDWSHQQQHHQQPHVITTPYMNYNPQSSKPSTTSTISTMAQQQHVYYSYGGISYASSAVTSMQPRNPSNTMHYNTNTTTPSTTILSSQPYHQQQHPSQYHVAPNSDHQQQHHHIPISSTNAYAAQPNSSPTVAFASSPTIYASSAAMLHSPQHQQNIQYTYPPNTAAATLPPTTTVLYPYSLSVVEPNTTYTVVASNSAPMATNDQHYLVVQQPNGQVLLTPASAAPTAIARQQQQQHQPQPHLNSSSYAAAVRFNNNRKSYNKRGTYNKEHQHDGSQKNIKQKNVLTSAKKKNDINLLEEFKRTYKTKNWTVEAKLTGHVVEFCQDQHGSRFLQSQLESDSSSTEGPLILMEILDNLAAVKNDVFGNYVLQKVLERGSEEMKSQLWLALKGEVMELSLQMYGCRVIQKAVETLKDEYLFDLIEEFRGHILQLIEDQNGNHVCQKLIEALTKRSKLSSGKGFVYGRNIEFIIEDVIGNITRLSCHPYGCRVLQRILEHCDLPQITLVLDEISKVKHSLLGDQYGNYVIQHVLQYGRVEDREGILNLVLEPGNGILKLSQEKFASNVVEKLLKYGNAEQRSKVLAEMLEEVENEKEGRICIVLLMVRDPYANYVVQTSVDVAPDGEARQKLLSVLNSNSEKLRSYTYAKHIVAKLFPSS